MNSRNQSLYSGILFIALGSSSYGMLSTLVKLAYRQNYTTAEVTLSQFLWGAVVLTVMGLFLNRRSSNATAVTTPGDIRQLLIAGIPTGLTSVFYYLTVRYIDASVAVVLLMQSVWMGVVVECIQKKQWPQVSKVFAVILVLFGTLLATGVSASAPATLDPRGVMLGLLSAMSFSWVLFASSSVAPHLPPIKRSQVMMYGGTAVVAIFAFLTQIGPHYFGASFIGEEFIRNQPFRFDIFTSYGLVVAIFGTVIPPIMLNKGFPKVGVGLGSIISSLELPFAVSIAFIFLDESVRPLQWFGVVVIIAAIVLLNYNLISKTPKDAA